MFIWDVRFPVSDGIILTALRAGLTALWPDPGLSVARKRPDPSTRRMVTLRNDSGPETGRLSRRRYGGNVWADDPVDAEKIALDSMRIVRTMPAGIVAATDSFSGPFEVPEDVPLIVDGKSLTHFYFTFRASIKGSKPTT